MNRRDLLISGSGGMYALQSDNPRRAKREAEDCQASAHLCEKMLVVQGFSRLKGIAAVDSMLVYVIAGQRGGIFQWRSGSFLKFVQRDTLEIIYVGSDHIPPEIGCWVRSYTGPIDIRWGGAETLTSGEQSPKDNSKAINAALSLATSTTGSVYIPAGNWGIGEAINVPEGVTLTGSGCGNLDSRRDRSGTNLIALSALDFCLKVTSNTKLSLFSVSGQNIARVGIMWDNGARPAASDLQVGNCTLAAFLFDSTQNGTFTNICGRFSKTCFAFVNQARNNRFFNATGEINSRYTLSHIYRDSALITLYTDFKDSLDLGIKTHMPMKQGNDRNEFFGGIFERAPVAVRFVSDGAFADRSANRGTTIFHGSELTAKHIIATDTAPDYQGVLIMNDTVWISDDQTTPMTVGNAGYISFQGQVNFSGAGELPNRGISVPSNYVEKLFGVRPIGSANSGRPVTNDALSWDTKNDTVMVEDSSLHVTIGPDRKQPSMGVQIRVAGPATRSNTMTASRSLSMTKSVVEVLFSLEGIPDGQLVHLYVDLVEKPYHRLLGRFGNGTHSVLHRFSLGEMARFTVGRGTIANGSGVASWRIGNITISYRG